MSYLPRILDLSSLVQERSLFLFGPRQTGKSSYLRHQLTEIPKKIYNLLDQSLLQRLHTNPSHIRQEIEAENIRDALVVIDEVQKCIPLLNEIHLMIEERGLRFLMTGSSARTLRKAGVNLLGGRARHRSFHPLLYIELRDTAVGYDLKRAMNHGLLPFHYLSTDPQEDLRAYVGRYLTEEIAAEGMARNIPTFSRFLQVAATANAQLINYSSLASDAQVARQTVQHYFDILKETFLGFELEPFSRTVKRKSIVTSKFYFFDPGIVRMLREIPIISENSKDFGDFFEHILFLELQAYIDYRAPGKRLQYWRSKSGFEVDFIFDQQIAIEVKASKKIQSSDMKGLKALREEDLMTRYIIVCQEPTLRLVDGIYIYPWQRFLDELWSGSFQFTNSLS